MVSSLEQAAELLAAGYPDKAAEICKKLLKEHPGHAPSLSLLGRCEMALGHFTEALAACQQAVALNPSDLDAHNHAGALHLAMGNAEAAMASFRAAIANGPNHPDGYNNLGTVLGQMGRLEEAEKAYAKSIELAPDAAETHNNMGGLLERQGRIADANASFGRAIALDPQHLRARVSQVRMFQCMQDLDGWRKAIAACAGLGPWPARTLGELLLNEAISRLLLGDLATCANVVAKMAELPSEPNPNVTDRTILAYRNFLSALVGYRLTHPAESAERFPSLPMVGDSHCLCVSDTVLVLDGNPYRVTPHLAMGCKAWHLASSAPGRLRMGFDFALRAAIGSLPDGADAPLPIIIGFGEIDCREDEGIYPHHKKNGTDPLAAAGPLARDYVTYVAEAVERLQGARNIAPVLHGVPAPLAGSLTLKGAEREMFLEMVRRFNRELGRQAAAHGMRFIDVYAATDRGDGTADGHHHLDNHHLRPEVLSSLFGSGGQ